MTQGTNNITEKTIKQQKILEEYEHQANLIIKKMFAVLVRAHEKVDKGIPRNVLEKIKSESL